MRMATDLVTPTRSRLVGWLPVPWACGHVRINRKTAVSINAFFHCHALVVA